MIEPLPSWNGERTWATFVDQTFHQYIRGNELQKSQDDLNRYEQLIDETRPEVVIETGTRHGGSALWFADHGLEVITIDVNPVGGWIDDRITYIQGSSVDLPITAHDKIDTITRGKRVMVSLDSDHHADHVVKEIHWWAPYVAPGCYLVIEDACFDTWKGQRANLGGSEISERGGPLKAIQQCHDCLLQLGFNRDIVIEGLSPISHSPCGWWRRS